MSHTNSYDPNGQTVTELPCGLCGEPTRMTSTLRCDRCWELERRIQSDPDIARRVLLELGGVFVLKSNFMDVQSFHNKFGLDRDRPPLSSFIFPKQENGSGHELQKFRLAFMLEELAEYAMAVGARELSAELHELGQWMLNTATLHWPKGENLVHAFDALLDLSVVTLGTADFHGFDWERGWDIVMERNMAKRRAKPDGSDSKRGSPFDVIKPEGWYGPELQLRKLLGE